MQMKILEVATTSALECAKIKILATAIDGEDGEPSEFSWTVDVNVKWEKHFRKLLSVSLNISFLYRLAFLLQAHYPRYIKKDSQKACKEFFLAISVTITKK